MITHERQHRIMQLLEQAPTVRVSQLSSSLGVSEATIRRDLDHLHHSGLVRRIHGGAVLSERAIPESPVLLRSADNCEEKRRIGTLAASLIQEGDSIFIGSGSTTLEVARNLVGRRNLTVITNALTVVNALHQEEGLSLVVAGGVLRSSELSFIGHLTEQALRELRPQKVIMGIRSINLAEGLTNDYLPEVSTDRVIIQCAPEVILVADHTKFGKTSTAVVAPVSAVNTLVTDRSIDPELLSELHSQIGQILLA
jgi:DeoR/GlpR family transcriptional regulator of sugar metabolism